MLIWAALLVTSCGKAGPPPADDTTEPAATAGASERAVALVDLDDAGEVATWTTTYKPKPPRVIEPRSAQLSRGQSMRKVELYGFCGKTWTIRR